MSHITLTSSFMTGFHCAWVDRKKLYLHMRIHICQRHDLCLGFIGPIHCKEHKRGVWGTSWGSR